MTGSDMAERSRSISTWNSEGNLLEAETFIRPEEHYYLRRKVRKRYRFRPRWNILVIIILFLLGNVVYLTLQNLVGLAGYIKDVNEREVLYQQKVEQKNWLISEKKRRLSDDYVNEQARKQGMIREGEQLYIMAQPLGEDQTIPVKKRNKTIVIEN
jgi:cell division protein FtsB